MPINLCNLHVDWSIWDMAHYPSEWKWLADFMSDAVRSENRWLMATRVTKGIVIHGNELIISFLTCVHFLNTMEMKSEIARKFRRKGRCYCCVTHSREGLVL